MNSLHVKSVHWICYTWVPGGRERAKSEKDVYVKSYGRLCTEISGVKWKGHALHYSATSHALTQSHPKVARLVSIREKPHTLHIDLALWMLACGEDAGVVVLCTYDLCFSLGCRWLLLQDLLAQLLALVCRLCAWLNYAQQDRCWSQGNFSFPMENWGGRWELICWSLGRDLVLHLAHKWWTMPASFTLTNELFTLPPPFKFFL